MVVTFWRPKTAARVRSTVLPFVVLAAAVTLMAPVGASASPSSGVLGPWVNQRVPTGVDHLELAGVSCAGTGKNCATGGTFCSPGGCGGLIPSGIMTTSNGGASWKKSRLPSNIGDVSDIACPSATGCIALALKGPLGPHSAVFLVTKNLGKSWAVVKTPGGSTPGAITCSSTTSCIAVGFASGGHGAIVATSNGGTSWKSLPVPTGVTAVTHISCSSKSRCLASGFSSSGIVFLSTSNGGRSWAKHTAPSSIGGINGISCPSSTKCYAVGENGPSTAGAIAVTTNSGAKWAPQKVPAGIVAVNGIACQTASRCAAVSAISSSSRVIIATINGGALWRNDRLPAGKGDLRAIECRSGGCLAVGIFIKFSHGIPTDNGPLILADY